MGRHFFKQSEVERRAARTLVRYQQITDKRLDLPIDPEIVGSVVFELHWDWDEIEEKPGERVLAALYCSDGRAVLNEKHKLLFDKNAGLERYTRGHEVGHADLHAPPGSLGGGVETASPIFHRDTRGLSASRLANVYWRERHADWYAAALLMPEDIFIPKVKESRLETPTDADRLAGAFGVSYSAFNVRLKQLGFPYFDKHGIRCMPPKQDPKQISLF